MVSSASFTSCRALRKSPEVAEMKILGGVCIGRRGGFQPVTAMLTTSLH